MDIQFTYGPSNTVLNLPGLNFSIQSFNFTRKSMDDIETNKFGKKFVNHRPSLRKVSGTLPLCNKEERRQLDAMFAIVGIHQKLTISLDGGDKVFTDGATRLSITGYFDEYPMWRPRSFERYDCSLKFTEGT